MNKRKLKKLRFTGGRFEENKGWLDFDALNDLRIYEKILIETAKGVWRSRNPEHDNLPRGLAGNILMGISNIQKGSCQVEIGYREAAPQMSLFPPSMQEEIYNAVDIIDETVLAASKEMPFPQNFPLEIVPVLASWGKSLGTKESIVLCKEANESPEFNVYVRQQIIKRINIASYEDEVDLVGEIRTAKLKATSGGAFDIFLEDGGRVSGEFIDRHEYNITEALRDHRDVRARIRGIGEFDISGKLKKILHIEDLDILPIDGTLFDPTEKPIWETVIEIGKSLPKEAWDGVPNDFASNIDHYLYGASRKN